MLLVAEKVAVNAYRLWCWYSRKSRWQELIVGTIKMQIAEGDWFIGLRITVKGTKFFFYSLGMKGFPS